MCVDGAIGKHVCVSGNRQRRQAAFPLMRDPRIGGRAGLGDGNIGIRRDQFQAHAARRGIHVRIRAADVFRLYLQAARTERCPVRQFQSCTEGAVRLGMADHDACGDHIEALILRVCLHGAVPVGKHLQRTCTIRRSHGVRGRIADPPLGEPHIDRSADGGAAAGQDAGRGGIAAASVDICTHGGRAGVQRSGLQTCSVFCPVQTDHGAACHGSKAQPQAHQIRLGGGFQERMYLNASRGVHRAAADDLCLVERGIICHRRVQARADQADVSGHCQHIHLRVVGRSLCPGLYLHILCLYGHAGGIQQRSILHAKLGIRRGQSQGQTADICCHKCGFCAGERHSPRNSNRSVICCHRSPHNARHGVRAVEGQQHVALHAHRAARDSQDLRNHARCYGIRYRHVARRYDLRCIHCRRLLLDVVSDVSIDSRLVNDHRHADSHRRCSDGDRDFRGFRLGIGVRVHGDAACLDAHAVRNVRACVQAVDGHGNSCVDRHLAAAKRCRCRMIFEFMASQYAHRSGRIHRSRRDDALRTSRRAYHRYRRADRRDTADGSRQRRRSDLFIAGSRLYRNISGLPHMAAEIRDHIAFQAEDGDRNGNTHRAAGRTGDRDDTQTVVRRIFIIHTLFDQIRGIFRLIGNDRRVHGRGGRRDVDVAARLQDGVLFHLRRHIGEADQDRHAGTHAHRAAAGQCAGDHIHGEDILCAHFDILRCAHPGVPAHRRHHRILRAVAAGDFACAGRAV